MIAGGGIGTIAIALIGYFVFGIDPNTTQQVISQFGGAQEQGRLGTPQDQAGQFVDVVSANGAISRATRRSATRLQGSNPTFPGETANPRIC
jgi:hypothetical protein